MIDSLEASSSFVQCRRPMRALISTSKGFPLKLPSDKTLKYPALPSLAITCRHLPPVAEPCQRISLVLSTTGEFARLIFTDIAPNRQKNTTRRFKRGRNPRFLNLTCRLASPSTTSAKLVTSRQRAPWRHDS